MGAIASAEWLDARGLDATKNPQWFVEIVIPTDTAETAFHLSIYPEEWGFVFRHATRVSSIRVTDIAFVHGRDEVGLLPHTPALARIGDLLAFLEQRYNIAFHRVRATVNANVPRATAAVRPWLVHQ